MLMPFYANGAFKTNRKFREGKKNFDSGIYYTIFLNSVSELDSVQVVEAPSLRDMGYSKKSIDTIGTYMHIMENELETIDLETLLGELKERVEEVTKQD